MQVGSKRFLTNKVDRSVTGLIAQQQCVGPFHTPLSNCAVTAQNYMSVTGTAISLGEQPIKTMIDTAAMARISVGEALTNLVFARVTDIGDIKISANWMWSEPLLDFLDLLRTVLVFSQSLGVPGPATKSRDVLVPIGRPSSRTSARGCGTLRLR